MPPLRRDFLKTVGVTLVSLVATGAACTRTSRWRDDGSGDLGHPAWARLRQCWLDLDQPFSFKAHDWHRERQAAHRLVLDDLVTAGEIDAPVADQMQIAFKETAYHIQQSKKMCYLVLPFEYRVRVNLLQQAKLLDEVAGDLDPDAVTKARAALARDIAFFDALAAGEPASKMYERYGAGEIVANPTVLEAARILVDLLRVRLA